MRRPFRFGIAMDSAASRAQWIEKARRAEDLGYSTLVIPDHFVSDFSASVALMAAADATTSLRVGSFVYDNDFRHPAVLAKEAATLDVLTGGRFEFGIGAGWLGSEYEQTGIPFDPPGVRISRMEESLTIIKQLFAGEPVTFEGNYYKISGLTGLPRPVQRPHPPIFIGGGGKRILSLAAREANIVGIHLKVEADATVPISERMETALAQKVAWVREAAGERYDSLELNFLTSYIYITNDRLQTAEQLAREKAPPGTTPELVLANLQLLIGSHEELIEEMQRRRELYDISYIVVFDEYMDAFAPVVARLAGK
jgi:probable F420-dependent oxidoreductase